MDRLHYFAHGVWHLQNLFLELWIKILQFVERDEHYNEYIYVFFFVFFLNHIFSLSTNKASNEVQTFFWYREIDGDFCLLTLPTKWRRKRKMLVGKGQPIGK